MRFLFSSVLILQPLLFYETVFTADFRQLMEIREVNLRRQRSGNSLLQYHGTNAIVEDAALEDLCGEAGCEEGFRNLFFLTIGRKLILYDFIFEAFKADNIENDNGALSAEQKAAMLDKLAKNNQTKKHFQVHAKS